MADLLSIAMSRRDLSCYHDPRHERIADDERELVVAARSGAQGARSVVLSDSGDYDACARARDSALLRADDRRG